MYKLVITSVRALQLQELKWSGPLENIRQNKIVCDRKKMLLTPQNEKKCFYFFHDLF